MQLDGSNSFKFFFESKYTIENKLILFYGIILFTVPFLSANQLVVGTIVNALLIKSALETKTRKVLLLSFIPSIAAFSSGFLFGSLTHQVLLMLPFIWAGNLTLALIIRKLAVKKKKNFLYSNLAAGTAKTALLFASAAVLFVLGLAPAIVLVAFGIMQFVTAEAGGVIVLGAKLMQKKLFAK